MKQFFSRSLFLISAGILVAALFTPLLAHAEIAGGVLCSRNEPCDARGVYTRQMVGTSRTDSIRLNPAKIPVESVTGVEAIYYEGMPTLGLVKGLGRVGAAVTPSNNEETFFGVPAAESDQDLLERMQKKARYEADKYTLGAGANVFTKKGSGFSHINLNVGVLLRYYGDTKDVAPGIGAQLNFGLLLFGGSIYEDKNTQTDSTTQTQTSTSSQVKTYSVGLSLTSLLLDYSVVETDGAQPATAQVATAALFLGNRTVLTASRREVSSSKSRYSFDQKTLFPDRTKIEYFAGLQYRVSRFLVLGVHYNYYLLREASAGVVIFF